MRNYRTAHARVAQIEPFEATLREHTPLVGIGDPGALAEFLNQRGLQGDMVLEELKRVTGDYKEMLHERDGLRMKLQEAEKQATDAFDEAAGLKKERDEQRARADEGAAEPKVRSDAGTAAELSDAGARDEAQEPAPEAATKQTKQPTAEVDPQKDELELQVRKQEDDLQKQLEYINELETENATHHQALDMCRLDLDAMHNKLSIRDREIRGLQTDLTEARAALEQAVQSREQAKEQEEDVTHTLVSTEGEVVNLQNRLKAYQENLSETHKELQAKAAAAEENLRKYQIEHQRSLRNGAYAAREDLRAQTYEGILQHLRAQQKTLEQARHDAEAKTAALKADVKRLEADVGAHEGTVARLRPLEARSDVLTKRLAEAEHARDDAQRLAESKRGHEAAVASLRSQLKRAEKDRDAAYQMILDCGKCDKPPPPPSSGLDVDRPEETPTESSATTGSRSRGGSDMTDQTDASSSVRPPVEIGAQTPTKASTPTLESEGGAAAADAKQKKKKKAKGKSKKESATTPSIAELIAEPDKANEILSNSDSGAVVAALKASLESLKRQREAQDDDRDEVRRHFEEMIEGRDQRLKDQVVVLRDREDEIERLTAEMAAGQQAIERIERKLRGEEGLRAEIETLTESLTAVGEDVTGAKREAQEARERRVMMQDELDEARIEADETRKNLKDHEARRAELLKRCNALETEVLELKTAGSSAGAASGEELTAAKEQIDALLREKKSLHVAKEACEKQVEELKAQGSASTAEMEAKHKSLSTDFERVSARASTLETDLAAANVLAQSRFREITELKQHITKVQPELKRLREEVAELKAAKSGLDKATATMKKLEARERDLKAEIAEYKTQAAKREAEMTAVRERAKKADERSSALEDTYERSRKDVEQNQRTRDEAAEVREKLQQQLDKAQAERRALKQQLEEAEKQARRLGDEAAALREEVQLRTAQRASAQSVMDGAQEQARELATQLKEAQGRSDGLEEELADSQRLLAERSREAETMRRLLADVEGRADARVKEMRERLELATEERDRAEEEANSSGRRRAREMEELKSRAREAEREAGRAGEAKAEADRREQEARTGRAELERRAAQAREETAEVRTAMARLREALDEGERQTREVEQQKAELRRAVEEREARLEKLQKSAKAMAEELRALQQAAAGKRQGSVQSSRSSLEDGAARIRSPGPRAAASRAVGGGGGGSNGTTGTGGGGSAEQAVDYVYLRHVLLQFLEQKEKKRQMQLVPVLGMLLHFDK